VLYSVAEISDLVGLSKVTIYKKLKQKELTEHIIKKAGITYVDDAALNLIKDSLKLNANIKNNLNDKDTGPDAKEEMALDVDDLADLTVETNLINDNARFHAKEEITLGAEDLTIKNDLINTLKQQLRMKDIQIQELISRLQQEQELHQNTQVLFKVEQDRPKDALVLRRGRKKEQKKSFWKKLFAWS